MSTRAGTTTIAEVPAVLTISSGIWLVLGALGTVWTLMGLLMVLAFSGMVAPQTYLPALALYLAGGALSVAGVVFAVLLRRGRRAARIVLSAYAVILPAVLYYPYFLGGPSAVGVPWRDVLLSPVGVAGVLAVAATVLMWLPPANAYLARRAAHPLETPANSEPPSGRVPRAVTAAGWILLIAGVVAALQAALGLVLFVGTLGSGGNTTPALVLWLTLAAVAAANLVCVNPVRRGKPFVRPIVTVIPLAGLTLVVLATIAGVSSLSAGSPGAAGGLAPAIFLTVFSQGLPLLAGLVAAVLVWLPSARRYFRRGAEVLPAGTSGS